MTRPEKPGYTGSVRRAQWIGSGVGAGVLFLALSASAAPEPLDATLRGIFEGEGPGRARVAKLLIRETSVTIGLELPRSVDLSDLPPAVENRFELAVGALAASRPSAQNIHLLVAYPGEPLRPPPRRLGQGDPPPKRIHSVYHDPARFPFGQALAGRTIALSPGHGYIYYDSLGGYSTQRGNVKWNGCGACRGITEDFETHEIVIRWLIPLLEGAGARVVLVRERSYDGEGVIVDDADPTFAEVSGSFAPGSTEGGHAAGYRAALGPGSEASWTLTAAASGPQLLSVWFVAGANRFPDARLELHTPGGIHPLLWDQRSHGRRWTPAGIFSVEAGESIEVRLSAPANAGPDGALIADAVRLGAGKHTTGHPWWRMGASPFAEYQGAPSQITSRGDVTVRPAYAEWYGADVYLSIHSNASGAADSTAAGTATYRYNCGVYADHSNDPPAADCDDPTGSDRLQELVHRGLVDQLEADWDSAWRDRGTKVANFGELRDLNGIPGALVETAFHDNVRLADGSTLRVTDNQALHDPRWRRAAAWGMYRGLTEFLVPGAPVLAPAPTQLLAKRVNESSVELSFDAVPNAMGYRVYAAVNGRGFDAGRMVQGSPARIDGLPADAMVGLMIASVNDAGEGRPSATVVARASARPAQLLVVDAFEREDAWVQELDNRHDTAFVHGRALNDVEHAFDSATEAALAAGSVRIEEYDGVVLALGRESTEHGIVTAALRDALLAFVNGGGAVFADGSELAWALDARGDEASRAFLADVFGAAYEADDAAATTVTAAPGGWLSARVQGELTLDDGTRGGLEAQSSDVLRPLADGVVELSYGGGAGAAGVRRGASLALGVALDSLSAPGRTAILSGWAAEAILLAPPEGIPGGDAGIEVPDGGALPDAGAEVDSGPPIAEDAGLGAPDAEPEGLGRLRATADPAVRGACGCTVRPGDLNEFGLLGAGFRGTTLGWGLGLTLILWNRRVRRIRAARRLDPC